MRCNLPKVLFLAINHYNWPITKKNPQNKNFYAKMMCMPFGPLK